MSSSSPALVPNMPAISMRQYREPPVHEVILSLVFNHPLDAAELESLPNLVGGQFSERARQDFTKYGLTIGPAGQQILPTEMQFAGWLFRDAGPTRLLNAGPSQLLLHAIRPGEWPRGQYAGWSAIQQQARELLELLAAIYGKHSIRRAGLRYLNRIALPVGSSLEDWLSIGFKAPDFLLDPFSINLRQTWSRCAGHDDLSVTVGLATIEIPETVGLRDDHVGFLFDIEAFNLWPDRAPSYQDLEAWCRRAHSVENAVFESAISESLRERFGVIRR